MVIINRSENEARGICFMYHIFVNRHKVNISIFPVKQDKTHSYSSKTSLTIISIFTTNNERTERNFSFNPEGTPRNCIYWGDNLKKPETKIIIIFAFQHFSIWWTKMSSVQMFINATPWKRSEMLMFILL